MIKSYSELDSFTILEREADWRRRGIREAIYVKRVVPGLNKSGGLRCVLSPLWDKPLMIKLSEPTELKMALD